MYAYNYETSSVYRNLEINDPTLLGFDNIKVWIDELLPDSTSVVYEISFDSKVTWYTLPEVSSLTLEDGYTEKELGGSIDDITSSAITTAYKFIIRISLANDASARYETPSNKQLRAIWY